MTDLDQLENDIGAYHWSDVANEELLRELVSRLRLSEKDAERYRWLKSNGTGSLGVPGGWFNDSDEWDEGIDAAMSKPNSRDSDT